MSGTLQSIMFRKSDWKKKDTESFLRHHGFQPIKPVHTTKTFYRYRLVEPDYRHQYKYRIITLSPFPEIKSVYMFKTSK